MGFFPEFLSTASTVGAIRRRVILLGTNTVPNYEDTFKYIHSVSVLTRVHSLVPEVCLTETAFPVHPYHHPHSNTLCSLIEFYTHMLPDLSLLVILLLTVILSHIHVSCAVCNGLSIYQASLGLVCTGNCFNPLSTVGLEAQCHSQIS